MESLQQALKLYAQRKQHQHAGGFEKKQQQKDRASSSNEWRWPAAWSEDEAGRLVEQLSRPQQHHVFFHAPDVVMAEARFIIADQAHKAAIANAEAGVIAAPSPSPGWELAKREALRKHQESVARKYREREAVAAAAAAASSLSPSNTNTISTDGSSSSSTTTSG